MLALHQSSFLRSVSPLALLRVVHTCADQIPTTWPQLTYKLVRKDGIKAKMAVMQRARLDHQLSWSKHMLVLQRTHIPTVQRHLRLFDQHDLADIVWATGKLAFNAARLDKEAPELESLQTAAVQAWPHARPWGTAANCATQFSRILQGMACSQVNATSELTSLLHHYTLQLLPKSNDWALADVLAAWERWPALTPARGIDVHAARVTTLLRRRDMSAVPLVRVLSYWASHVGRIPAAVDVRAVEEMAALLTARCMRMPVVDVHALLHTWARLGGVPAGLDVAACVDVLRAHDYQPWNQGHAWVDHLFCFDHL